MARALTVKAMGKATTYELVVNGAEILGTDL